MLLDAWKTGTVDGCFHLSFTRLIFQLNSSTNTLGGTKYIYFKQVVPARSRWSQLVPARSRWIQLVPGGSSSLLVLVCMDLATIQYIVYTFCFEQRIKHKIVRELRDCGDLKVR